jgi:hypothetical protein
VGGDQATTVSKRDQRLAVRAFNGVQRTIAALGRPKAGFVESIDALHAKAAAAAGVTAPADGDFGDPSYREGLRVLCEAYDRESKLTPFGRMLVEQQLIGILRNRLVAERTWRERPEILDLEIRKPIFVLGLPRTGTTALHHLVGQDPRIQVLEYWLAAAPAPRPPRERWESDPRFKEAARGLKMTYYLDPDLKAIHLMTAEGPEECRHLLQQTFTDDTFDCNATIPSYSAWYGAHDMRDAYVRHRDLLKLIGSPTPERRWVLKYPVHMGNLEKLLEIYPDACIVQTHRDPAKVMASICSLVAGWRAIYEDGVDRRAVAEWQLDLWSSRLMRAMEVRGRRDPAQFFDLGFRDVVADPVSAIERMYAHFGVEHDEGAIDRIRAWRRENPPGKHGEHRYTAADFGLTGDAIADRFASYMKHFAIERE